MFIKNLKYGGRRGATAAAAPAFFQMFSLLSACRSRFSNFFYFPP